MTILDELETLTKAATPGPWIWKQVVGMGARRFLYGPDVKQPILELDVGFPTCDFIAAANPTTILALIKLCKQQHEALKNTPELCRTDEGDEALTAYEQFNQGEQNV